MPIVISRRTGEIVSGSSVPQEHSDALHRAIMAAEIKLNPDRFSSSPKQAAAESKTTR